MENKLVTVPDKDMPNLSRIVYEGGGTTPEILSGLYTGYTMAKKAIDAYNQLKPVHEPQVYNSDKNLLSKEDEAEAFEKVQEQVAKENKKLEAKKDGKAKVTANKNKSGTEHVRKGADDGSKSVDVSREREPS